MFGKIAMSDPVWRHASVIAWSRRLLDSYRRWIGEDLLIRTGSSADQARTLFEAPFVVVSHGTEPDPILNYGNQAALDLWEMTWEQLLCTPSRRTAEPVDQEERARMLRLAEQRGYFDRYQGVRISSTGRRFRVDDATVWNVVDGQGTRVGQAATFSRWTPLP